MARTDVHSPTNLITEDYEYAYSYDSHPEEGDQRYTWPILQALIAEGWHFGQVHGGETCDHCGHRLRYVAVLKHMPTHTLIKVGEQCLDNRFDLATEDFHRLRKEAKLNRERRALKDKRAEWFAINPDREIAFTWASEQVSEGHFGYEGMRHKFVHSINRWGDTSDKFVRAIMRDMARTELREWKRERERAELKPVIEGKGIVIEGEVLSVKWQENDFGGRFVTTVKDDRGFIVWGSRPSKIHWEKGDRVRFKAGTVTKSDRDETFGFFKRPTSAEVI